MSTKFFPACSDEPAAMISFFAGRLRLLQPALRASDRADRTRAHTLAGGLFLVLNALHVYEYRRNLLH